MLEFVSISSLKDPKIELLWNAYCQIHQFQDRPTVWKLTKPYIQALLVFFNHEPDSKIELILENKFMGIGIDITSSDPRLVGDKHYVTLQDFEE